MAEHHFDTDVAKEYGVNAAVILHNINFWLEKNEANGSNLHDGNYWTYNSVKAFKKQFYYLSEKAINTALKKLEKEGIIVTGKYNSSAYDRTKWYALTERGKAICRKGKSICQKGQMEEPERENGFAENGEPIPYRKPDTKPDSKTAYACSEPVRHKHGEYKNVLLTDEELSKLKTEFPADWEERIESLSSYMASVGKPYKDHLATIRNWARRERNEKKKEQSYKDRVGDTAEWLFPEDMGLE